MAAKRRNRRRRRGRAPFPLRLLCLAVVIAAFLGALTMFFRIDMIVVEGNERYTEEQIIEAAGVQKEQNLVLLNKYDVKQAIFDALPYVETVVVNRKYPDALLLTVTECVASAALPGADGTWLMSDSGKILERTATVPDGCVRVTGCELSEPSVGAQAAFSEEESYKLDRLLAHVERHFGALAEFTVEAGRPDTLDAQKLRMIHDHPVTRISINPQTMKQATLDLIGRHHTVEEIEEKFRMARSLGFDNINMDLIAGLPGDTPDGFRATLEQVLALAPENVTVHTLSRKRGSNLMAQDAPIPDGAAVGEMLDFAGTVLPRAGYAPYYLYRQKFMSGGFENVGWTRPGQENLYNICIMEELCSILAMGGGASTKLVRPNGGRLERHIDPKYPTEYIANIDRICAAKAELEAFFQ